MNWLRRQKAAAATAGTAINDVFAALVVLFVAIVPIPAGSNRPVIWLAWAAASGFFFALYHVLMALREPRRELRALDHRWPLLTGLGLTIFVLAQVLLPDQGDTAGLAPQISISVSDSLLGLARLFTYGLVFALVIEVANSVSRVEKLGWSLYWVVTLHAVWGVMALNLLGDFDLWGMRQGEPGVVTGFFINRNSFATFLGMGLVLGLALTLGEMAKPRMRRARNGLADGHIIDRALIWLSLAFNFVALLGTQSRMGLFATVTALFVVFVVMRIKATGKIVGPFLQACAALLAGPVVLIFLLGQAVLDRSVMTEISAQTRLDLYAQTLELIRLRPWTGWGFDTFASAYPLVHRPPVSTALVWDLAHNSYLMLWVELGLIAGSLPIVMLAGIAVGLVRRTVRRSSGFALPVAGIGVLVLGAIHSLTDFSLEIEANTIFLIVVLALGLARLRSGSGLA